MKAYKEVFSMAKIQFRNKAHRDFVFENLEKCRHNDCYHQAFFYVMGISEETRMNIGKMFDFKNDCIVPETFRPQQGQVSGGS